MISQGFEQQTQLARRAVGRDAEGLVGMHQAAIGEQPDAIAILHPVIGKGGADLDQLLQQPMLGAEPDGFAGADIQADDHHFGGNGLVDLDLEAAGTGGGRPMHSAEFIFRVVGADAHGLVRVIKQGAAGMLLAEGVISLEFEGFEGENLGKYGQFIAGFNGFGGFKNAE